MEKILSNFIDELNNILGVRAAYLVNNRGEILFPTTENLGRSLLNASASLALVQAMGVFELPGEDIQEMEVDFQNAKIMIYHNIRMNVPTKLGAHETFLVVVGTSQFNKAHLRMALNVSVSNVITHKKYKKLDAPVRIRKTSVMTREHLSEQESTLLAEVRSLVT
jgi:hypothetical protein